MAHSYQNIIPFFFLSFHCRLSPVLLAVTYIDGSPILTNIHSFKIKYVQSN